MIQGGQEVIVGAVTDGSFGKLVAFGLGGVLVEVLKDITFRLAPATREDALSMLDGIKAAEMLKGVRGSEPVSRDALATLIVQVSQLGQRLPRNRRDGPEPGVREQERRDRRRRAHRRRLRREDAALPPGRGRRAGEHEALDAAEGDRGHRRVRRGRQDRQLGDEEPDQRRLQGRDLPDPPEGRRDHGPQGLQEREGRPRRDRHGGVRDPREASSPAR
jgi:acyl-CoA synthetase (NDP forming)